ncbi:MAG: tryptophan-rich sensory protein [Candidatus Pacebacteria bacterium]|nr:tryptophan-rich sensory protein [Candidatus Paceibacterota bacterium]
MEKEISNKRKFSSFLALIVSIAICEFAGIVGSFFTFSEIPTWYATITKPAINPPSWVFGPVWTTLFFLMGISAFLVWRKMETNREDVKMALSIFGFQLILNTLWSIIFFGMHNIGLALAEIVVLWLAIVWTIVEFYKLSRASAYLLLPYIVWVTFAGYLTYNLWVLN